MKKKHILSVIVSIFNIAPYLERAIESICGQTYHSLEIILVDDGSTDESGSICDQWAEKDARIRVLHKKNGGLSSARNAGIEIATGEYLAFVDGDDWIEPCMYERMISCLEQKEAQLAICNYKEITKDGILDSSEEKVTVFEKEEALEAFVKEEESYRIQNAAWNKLYKRSLLGELRFPEGKLFEDIVFTTKLIAKSERTVYLHECFYNYVCDRSDSIMNSVQAERILKDQVEAYREKGSFLNTEKYRKYYHWHQYFFLKRMLLHYLRIYKERPEGYQEYLKQLKKIIQNGYSSKTYENKPKGDQLRIRLFLLSPVLFLGFTKINESWILPYKELKASEKEELVVIQLSGGLGNQMFQYALYLQLKSLGRKVKIDDVTEYRTKDARPVRLDVFGITYDKPTKQEMRNLTDSSPDLMSKIRRKLTGRRTKEYREKDVNFDPAVWEKKRAYLTGCWQSEKYFSSSAAGVKKAFTFPVFDLSEQMKAYVKAINESNSVCVHIRRGDYLQVSEVYGGICTEEYYAAAMEKMKQAYPDCHFFLFTNDAKWVKENYKARNITVVEGNDEDKGYLDLYLMTLCRHFILANSSFSWWAAYLGEYKDKIIIAPDRWANNKDYRDIYTPDMQRLPS